MSGFLPSDYEVPQTGNFMKLAAGEHRIRVLGSAIVGNLFWKTEGDQRRPVRRRMSEQIVASELGVDPKTREPERISHFWAFPVWNYGAKQVQILELTQKTVMGSIESLARSADWGDPMEYDITITRTGTTRNDTEYTVMPSPKRPLDSAVASTWRETKINLEALYDGADPFATAAAPSTPTAGSNGHAAVKPAGGANPVETTITGVEVRDRGPAGKVWLLHTEAGDFGTFDQQIGVRCIHLASSKAPVALTWKDNSKGGRLIETMSELQPVAAGGGGLAPEDDPNSPHYVPF